VIEGRKVIACRTPSLPAEPSREWDQPPWIGKSHSKSNDTFDIEVQCVQCLAKRLAPMDLAPLIVESGICGSEKILCMFVYRGSFEFD